jgi:flavodoxin
MHYEIAYVSQSGNTENLAYGIADALGDSETVLTDLSQEQVTGKADVYLIGYGINKGAVPLTVMDALDELHEKEIIFLVTCGIEPTDEYKSSVEKKIVPFISDDCDYKGLFMCYGEWDEKILNAAKAKLAEEPDNPSMKKVVEEAKKAASHPTEDDYANAAKFIAEKLAD